MRDLIKVIVLLTIVFLIYGVYNHGYSAGKADKESEYQQAYIDAVEQQRKEFNNKLKEAKEIAESDRKDVEVRTVIKQKIEYRTKEVIRYVDREIKVPGDCVNLASNITRVFIDTTSAVTTSTRGEDGNTTRTDDTLSEFTF